MKWTVAGFLLAKNYLLIMVTKADVALSWAEGHRYLVQIKTRTILKGATELKKRTRAKRKVWDSDKDRDYTSRSTRAKKGGLRFK